MSECDLWVLQDAVIDMAKNKGNYESGIVSLQGMQSIQCISRELLHVDKTSGVSWCGEKGCVYVYPKARP